MRWIRENAAAKAALRQQENDRRGIMAERIEGNASEFHWATFYHGDMGLKESVTVRGANTYRPGERRNGTGHMFCT